MKIIAGHYIDLPASPADVFGGKKLMGLASWSILRQGPRSKIMSLYFYMKTYTDDTKTHLFFYKLIIFCKITILPNNMILLYCH